MYGCVELNSQATRPGDWLAGLAAGFERLVHPSATGEERARRGRLLGILLAGPFIVSLAVVQAFGPQFGIAGALAALCAVFGASWLGALYLAARPEGRGVELAALAGGSVLAGSVIALSGGLGAPGTMLLAAIPIEAWWVTRSRRAATAAGACAFGAALVAGIAGGVGPVDGAAWMWLTPLFYVASLAVRFHLAGLASSRSTSNEIVELPETCFDAAVIRFNKAGEVERISAKAGDLFGVEPALLLGTGLFERIHVADRVGFLCAAARTRDEGDASRCDVRVRMPATADGQAGGYAPFEAEFVKPTADVATVVAIIRDGREKASLQARLAEAVEQAGATDVAKGRFLATVSHELRTPLNAIIGFSEMLLHSEISGALAPRQAEHVTVIREAGNHLLSVVNAILDVSKIEAGSYEISVEPFDLRPAVDLSCAMLEPQAAAKGVTLTTKLPAGLGDVAGDQRAVQQILINLLSNAVKFTPEGGNVVVTAARKDDMIRIFVNDTGIGIGADDLCKLGRPFMQVQNDYTRQFQGTGLGLSLVKGLVRLHGGTMSMESAPGLGTTVTIGLPAATAAAQENRDETGEKGERHGNTLRKIA